MQTTEARRRVFVTDRVDATFRRAVEDWSADDESRLPTKAYLRHRLDEELLLLIDALGPWAEVPPDEIFPPTDWWERFS